VTDIYVVRHGNTFDKGDVVTRVGARTDLSLSQSGRDQVAALATHFAENVPQGFSAAYCSPLRRTRETAEAILAKSSTAPELTAVEFLREVDYGPDENRPETEVIQRVGEAALQAWESKAVPPPGWEIEPEEVRAAWSDFLSKLSRRKSDRPVLIVTSNGIARFVLDVIENDGARPEAIKLKTGAYGMIENAPERPVLRSWNVRP
jgi:broad specificity phosphatase PhoE